MVKVSPSFLVYMSILRGEMDFDPQEHRHLWFTCQLTQTFTDLNWNFVWQFKLPLVWRSMVQCSRLPTYPALQVLKGLHTWDYMQFLKGAMLFHVFFLSWNTFIHLSPSKLLNTLQDPAQTLLQKASSTSHREGWPYRFPNWYVTLHCNYLLRSWFVCPALGGTVETLRIKSRF